MRLSAPSLCVFRQDFSFRHLEEALLIRPDLMQVHVCETGIDICLDFLMDSIHIRAADHGLGDEIWGCKRFYCFLVVLGYR